MSEPEREVGFDSIASILFEEFDAPASMTPKAFYKIVYFIDQKLIQQGYTTGVNHFWYKYGTMTVTGGSAVVVEPSGDRSEVSCTVTPSELDLDTAIEDDLRSVTVDVLALHERLNTEGLTDLMYKDAPYEFQRRYRRLDTTIQSQISSHGKKTQAFDRDGIRESMNEFIDVFPEENFSGFVNDLYLWYDIFSTALDHTTATLEDVEDIAEVFWTIIMIEIATSSETGVSERVLANELDIDDPDGLQGYLRYRLRELEKEYLRVENTDDALGEVADEVMASQLGFIGI